jgi:hypothetical protein
MATNIVHEPVKTISSIVKIAASGYHIFTIKQIETIVKDRDKSE